MKKLVLSKRDGRLAGLILAVPVLLLGLYSLSLLAPRPDPIWLISDRSGQSTDTPLVGPGAALSIEMTAHGYRIPGLDSAGTNLEAGDIRLTHIAGEAGESGVERILCITNTGAQETRGLVVEDRIEMETPAGVFEPLPGMVFELPVSRELMPRERWCQAQKYVLFPTPGTRHQITTTVTITNHASLLPGNQGCPSATDCLFRLSINAIFHIPALALRLATPSPVPAPLHAQPTGTADPRQILASIPEIPPAAPPGGAPPPPYETAPPNPPQPTDVPPPDRSTLEPDPTRQEPLPSRTSRPTRTPTPPEPTATSRPDPTQPPPPSPDDEDPGKQPKPTKPPDPDKKPKPTHPPKPDHPPKPTHPPKPDHPPKPTKKP